MLLVKEYLNVLKTNIIDLLNAETDRKKTIETLITELEKRYKNAVTNLANLTIQRDTLVKEMEDNSQKIENLKEVIDTDFNSFNEEKT
jgi:phage shock protein A